MRPIRWAAAAAAGLALAAAVPAAAVPAAAAAPQPSAPVTVTLSAEQVQRICQKRIPRIERRASRALERIAGGPEVRGSVEWLKAKAARERAAGRETSARLLEERADRRADRVPQVENVKAKAAEFKAEHCGSR